MSFYSQLVDSVRSPAPSGSLTPSMAAEKLADIDELFDHTTASLSLILGESSPGCSLTNASDHDGTRAHERVDDVVRFSEAEHHSIGFVPATASSVTFPLSQNTQSEFPINAPVVSKNDTVRGNATKDDHCGEHLVNGAAETQVPPPDVEIATSTMVHETVLAQTDEASEQGYSKVFESFSGDSEGDAVMEGYYAGIKKEVTKRQKNLKRKQQKNAKATAPPTPRRRPIRKDVPQMATIGGVELDLAEHPLRNGTVGFIHSLMAGPNGSGPHPIQPIPKGNKRSENKSSPVPKSPRSGGKAGKPADGSFGSPIKNPRKRKANPPTGFSNPRTKKLKIAPTEKETDAPLNMVAIPSIETEELAPSVPSPPKPEVTRSRFSSVRAVRSPTPEEYRPRSPETVLHMAGIATHDWAYPGPYPNGGKPPPSPTPADKEAKSFATEAAASPTQGDESFYDGTFIAPADGTFVAPAEGAFRAPSEDPFLAPASNTKRENKAPKRADNKISAATPGVKRKRNTRANDADLPTPAPKRKKTAKAPSSASKVEAISALSLSDSPRLLSQQEESVEDCIVVATTPAPNKKRKAKAKAGDGDECTPASKRRKRARAAPSTV